MARKKANAEGETKKAKADKPRVAETQRSESKGRVEIAAVPIALLERHTNLPEREVILSAFADGYGQVLERARELARAMAEPPPPAKKGRTPVDPPTLPSARPVDRPMTPAQIPLPALHIETKEVAAPVVAPPAEPADAADVVDTVDTVEIDEGGAHAADDGDDADAFFASLRADRSEPSEEASEFDLPPVATPAPAPQEDRTTMIAAMPDDEPAPQEDRTTMIAAMPDDEPAAQEDRTTMIQAIADDEEGAPSEGGGELMAPEAKTRKSRKATKRKRG